MAERVRFATYSILLPLLNVQTGFLIGKISDKKKYRTFIEIIYRIIIADKSLILHVNKK